MLELLHFCMCVRIGWKQRALVFSMKLSNAIPVSTCTWMGDILTQQCSVECSCIFLFIYLFIYLFFVNLFPPPAPPHPPPPHYFVTRINDYVLQRNLVFSMKLSNANPVSAWMGERLTLPGAVDFSCIFFSSFSVPAPFFIILSFIAIVLFAYVLQTPFPMT